ncbi:MAG: 3-hydroxyacyl-CoA dehydrogenase NAD-binding domain-containing protein [Gemmatimonadaceae bacterium]
MTDTTRDQPTSGRLPETVAIIGAGTIGSGWSALFAAYGARVLLYDTDDSSLSRAKAQLGCARALGVGNAAEGSGSIERAGNLADAVRESEWIQESLPENISVKREMLAKTAESAPASAIIASSTSTFRLSDLAPDVYLASRLLIAHPLHPVYAVPVVELAGVAGSSHDTIQRAQSMLRALGREPIIVNGDVPGLVSNRLTAALLREALDLVARGVVSDADIDRLVARGVALGWTAVGPLATEAIGSGEGTFAAFLHHMEKPLSDLWQTLAAWKGLETEQRIALTRALSQVRHDSRAQAVPMDSTTAECEWPGAIMRIRAAAEAELPTRSARP